jgi:hypothetical protein
MTTLLADIFHASVTAVEGYRPFVKTDWKGMVKVEMPAPAEVALRNLGLKSWVPLDEIPMVLRRLSSLVRIGMTYTKGLGKDKLLRLSSMNRGAILRRAQIDTGAKLTSRDKRLLLNLLNNMPAKAGHS